MSETLRAQPRTAGAPTNRHAAWIPAKGESVERLQNGVNQRGEVFYSDQLQVLIKWDNGTSSSLRVDQGDLRSIRHRGTHVSHIHPRVDTGLHACVERDQTGSRAD